VVAEKRSERFENEFNKRLPKLLEAEARSDHNNRPEKKIRHDNLSRNWPRHVGEQRRRSMTRIARFRKYREIADRNADRRAKLAAKAAATPGIGMKLRSYN